MRLWNAERFELLLMLGFGRHPQFTADGQRIIVNNGTGGMRILESSPPANLGPASMVTVTVRTGTDRVRASSEIRSSGSNAKQPDLNGRWAWDLERAPRSGTLPEGAPPGPAELTIGQAAGVINVVRKSLGGTTTEVTYRPGGPPTSFRSQTRGGTVESIVSAVWNGDRLEIVTSSPTSELRSRFYLDDRGLVFEVDLPNGNLVTTYYKRTQ
jgi:hypothetical protein